jgi:hypothetical protein
MAEFTISLLGKADPDEIREAFEIAVRAIKSGLAEAGFDVSGELVLDGVVYGVDDVADETAGADSEEATDSPT